MARRLAAAVLAWAAASAAIVAAPAACAAQERADGAVYSGRARELGVHPPRLDEVGVVTDGRLDETQWTRAALLTGFSRFSPTDGVPAEDSTEVRVWYSASAIHFGIHAFERHGAPRATLADRDRIGGDDNVQILIGTFHDGRQAAVFAVNPLGVQADGTIVESNQNRTTGFGGGALAREPADVSADFVFQSRGRITDDGYVVEVRIPFKSLKYQTGRVQTWDLNVVRQVQHSGYEDSWAPARRAGLSFLAQSGTLEGLVELRRGVVVDLNPELTQQTVGAAAPRSGSWQYEAGRPRLGGNARWGVTNNLTLNGTIDPDFSQVEADAGQLSFDPRSALFFPEKRPFFLDGLEQFTTPHTLIHTRSIVQPRIAVKLTGKAAGTNIAALGAVDDRAASLTGGRSPVIALLRVQRDVGTSSRVGLAYTDRVDGDAFNRVLDVDASYLLGTSYSIQGQYAQSLTGDGRRVVSAPLWRLDVNRNGRHLAFGYSLDGVHEDFRAQNGFIQRRGIVTGSLDQRYTWFGAPGALVEALTLNPSYGGTWRYQAFVRQGEQLEKKLHVTLNATVRGGWRAGAGYFVETFGFDPELYGSYRVLGVAGDTLPFVGTARIPNNDYFVSLTSPPGARLSASAFYLWGRDENFFEWASSRVVFALYSVAYRPTDRLRLDATYNLQGYNRPSDGSIVGNTRLPRLKLEYQIARPVFVRLVAEYASVFRDALRDEGRTGRPLLLADRCSGGTYGITRPCQHSTFRGDLLFSYQPVPGTVVFVGYGAAYADARLPAQPFEFPGSLRLRGYDRTGNAVFVKASYLYRL